MKEKEIEFLELEFKTKFNKSHRDVRFQYVGDTNPALGCKMKAQASEPAGTDQVLRLAALHHHHHTIIIKGNLGKVVTVDWSGQSSLQELSFEPGL